MIPSTIINIFVQLSRAGHGTAYGPKERPKIEATKDLLTSFRVPLKTYHCSGDADKVNNFADVRGANDGPVACIARWEHDWMALKRIRLTRYGGNMNLKSVSWEYALWTVQAKLSPGEISFEPVLIFRLPERFISRLRSVPVSGARRLGLQVYRTRQLVYFHPFGFYSRFPLFFLFLGDRICYPG